LFSGSSTAIYHLQNAEGNGPVVYYFFDFSNDVKRTALSCLYSIALQLCEQLPALHESISSLHDRCRGGSADVHGLSRAIGSMLRDSSQPYVFIDALDECFRDDQERQQVVSCLAHFQSVAKAARLFVSSRPESEIAELLEDVQVSRIRMESAEIDKDIQVYVRSQLARDRRLKKMTQRVKDDIEKNLISRADGM
jgi:hypothetical protein